MTSRRPEPPPPPSEPPSVLLLRAIGDLQSMEGGEPITDIEAVVLLCGLVFDDIVTLIAVGVTAGYLDDDDGYCTIGLSAKGQRWYERGCPLGSMPRWD